MLVVLEAKAQQLAGSPQWSASLASLGATWVEQIDRASWEDLLAQLNAVSELAPEQAEGVPPLAPPPAAAPTVQHAGQAGAEQQQAGHGAGPPAESSGAPRAPPEGLAMGAADLAAVEGPAEQHHNGGAASGGTETQADGNLEAGRESRATQLVGGRGSSSRQRQGVAAAGRRWQGLQFRYGLWEAEMSHDDTTCRLGRFADVLMAACVRDVGALWRQLRKGGECEGKGQTLQTSRR